MLTLLKAAFCAGAASAALVARDYSSDAPLTKCPGYKASNVQTTANGLTADLSLAGQACNAYGDDLRNLKLTVSYETGTRAPLISLSVLRASLTHSCRQPSSRQDTGCREQRVPGARVGFPATKRPGLQGSRAQVRLQSQPRSPSPYPVPGAARSSSIPRRQAWYLNRSTCG